MVQSADMNNLDDLALKPTISYDEFSKLDIRAGTVIEASLPDWSKKLIRYIVDFGPLGKRTLFSGIRAWYSPEDLIGKQYPFVFNLQPKKMGDEESQGMMLMADTIDGNLDDSARPTLTPLQTLVANGTVIR